MPSPLRSILVSSPTVAGLYGRVYGPRAGARPCRSDSRCVDARAGLPRAVRVPLFQARVPRLQAAVGRSDGRLMAGVISEVAGWVLSSGLARVRLALGSRQGAVTNMCSAASDKIVPSTPAQVASESAGKLSPVLGVSLCIRPRRARHLIPPDRKVGPRSSIHSV